MTDQQTLTMEDLQQLVSEGVEKTIRDMGLDKTDIKHVVMNDKDDPEETKELTGDQKIMKFFTAMVSGDQINAKALSEGTPADGGTSYRPNSATLSSASSTRRASCASA